MRLHFQVIEDYGGSHGVRDDGRLKSVVKAPAQIIFGETQYATIYDKAAAYLGNIIRDHPFSDGNKRTALTVCAIFLSRNGHVFIANPRLLEDFVVRVATDHLSIAEISAWIKTNTKST